MINFLRVKKSVPCYQFAWLAEEMVSHIFGETFSLLLIIS